MRHPTKIKLLIGFCEVLIFLLAGVSAFLLRFEFSIPRGFLNDLFFALPVWALLKTVAFYGFRLHRGWWGAVSMEDAVRIVFANLAGSLASTAVILATGPAGFPRSIYVLDFILCLLATLGLRMANRVAREGILAAKKASGPTALIYGAGAAGTLLLKECRTNPDLAYHIVGFIDDDERKQGMRLSGVEILGTGENLWEIVQRRHIEFVLIAMPSVSGAEMTQILNTCSHAKVQMRTMPTLAEMFEGKGRAAQVRAVAVEDLLGRKPCELEEPAIRDKIGGKTVMVTGAGGSIGSELCRQIARFGASKLVCYEIGETPLFFLDRDLKDKFPGLDVALEVGCVQKLGRLRQVMMDHRPSIVFHAAAYKHVPMMEANAFQAVENNILGTMNVAVAATEAGVDDFVMISSDKAVNPTNIMGVTKRAAELVIRALGQEPTKFVSVRFGNVLGSNGSVIPIFRQQIANGGPVTVTHPEMRRYFMTIPEASQLVLQASTMGKGGEIFVLDMGDPVKIVDLARNLILLSGLRPGEDIKIEFTGARPGEKLFEELNTTQEALIPTRHDKIQIFKGAGLPPGCGLEWTLKQLRQVCENQDLAGLVMILKKTVPEYNPSEYMLEKAFQSTPKQEKVISYAAPA